MAVLGRYVAAGREIGETMTEIKKLRGLTEQAATELFAFVWPRAEEPPKE
jgi:hypothetical protein